MDELRYPIGTFTPPASIEAACLAGWIDDLERLPAELAAQVEGMSEAQLETPYRPGGWTARQVVHHVADSHLNSLVRFKWALTEERPTIKAYDEKRWAELVDYRTVPLEVSLRLLAALHERLVGLLRGLDAAQLERAFVHPESGATVRLAENVGIYAWHGRHHLAHVQRAARGGA